MRPAEQQAKSLWDVWAPTLPSLVVGIAGFWIVHHLSKMRQRRDETFKLAQNARDQVAETATAAVKIWAMKPSPARAKEVQAIYAKFGRLGRHLTMLKARSKKFDLSAPLVEFRRTATRDIEEADPTNAERRGDILAAADVMEECIDAAFLKVYG